MRDGDGRDPERSGAPSRPIPAIVALVLAAFFAGFPLFWLITSALKRPRRSTRLPPVWLPAQPSLDAFGEAFRLLPIG